MTVQRCPWAGIADPLYRDYHDHEWGRLNLNEDYLYEMLVLESAQAGLSWLTILKKRDHYRQAFAGFDVTKVACFDEVDYKRLMNDPGIIRNRRKIMATINNARVLVSMHEKGQSLAQLLHEAVPQVIVHHPQQLADVPAKTDLSVKLAGKLKQQGFRFVGPTTIYSFLQAVGLVNDHLEECSFKYDRISSQH